MKNKNSIILFCGVLDSVVTSYYVKKKLSYKKIIILFFNYGQKSYSKEKSCSKKCAKNIGADFNEINLKWLGKISNSLINKKSTEKKIKLKFQKASLHVKNAMSYLQLLKEFPDL